MQKLKAYISILMLVLLLFPIVETMHHELENLQDEHCGETETHYCPKEHSCDLCDYVFAASTTPPKNNTSLNVTILESDYSFVAIKSQFVSQTKFTFSLRGPPVC